MNCKKDNSYLDNLYRSVLFFRIIAVKSPDGAGDTQRLLIYWIVYSLFTFVEYFGHGLLSLLLFSIDCFMWCLSCSPVFYWLGKCIFLLWFFNTGSRVIERRSDADNDEGAGDNDLLNGIEGCKYISYG